MGTKMFVFLGFLVLIFLPNIAVSDCVDLGRVTGWFVQGEDTVLFYNQNTPVAKVVMKDCTLNSSSNVRLMKSYLCDEDGLIVDDQQCAIMTLISASGGSF
jgi:hypothetical protein